MNMWSTWGFHLRFLCHDQYPSQIVYHSLIFRSKAVMWLVCSTDCKQPRNTIERTVAWMWTAVSLGVRCMTSQKSAEEKLHLAVLHKDCKIPYQLTEKWNIVKTSADPNSNTYFISFTTVRLNQSQVVKGLGQRLLPAKISISSIKRPGRLFIFSTFRVGAYSRWALIKFSQES